MYLPNHAISAMKVRLSCSAIEPDSYQNQHFYQYNHTWPQENYNKTDCLDIRADALVIVKLHTGEEFVLLLEKPGTIPLSNPPESGAHGLANVD